MSEHITLHDKLQTCLKLNFEDTCEAIDIAISNGLITSDEIGEDGIYPDDVGAVESWIEARAEELHSDI